jgi:HK97 family phage major capsid protein
MSDLVLDRNIKVMSGEADRELLAEKLEIAADLAREKTAIRERRFARNDFEIGNRDGFLPTIAALTAHERRNYSLARLCQNLVSGQRGLEHEISDSLAHDIKSSAAHGGVLVPFRLTAMDTKTDQGGGYTTAPSVSKNIIDALVAQSAVLRLGATLVTGLKFDFQIATEANVLAASWVAENPGTDVPQSDPSFAARILRPHPAMAVTTISKQLLTQSSPDLEAWLRNRIAKAHALLLDPGAIHGSGTSNQVLGILNTSGVTIVPIGANGGAVTAEHLIAMESAVAAANGDFGSLAFLTNSVQRAKLRGLAELTGGSIPLWKDDHVLGYPALSSNEVRGDLTKGSAPTCSAVLFGNWNQLIVGEFSGALELLYDPFEQKRKGLVELSSYASYDCGLMQPAAFAAVLDAI